MLAIRTRVGLMLAALSSACGSASVVQPAAAVRQQQPTESKTRIDLELSDASIYDALRALAKRANINLDVDPDLSGTVTLKVRSTPWDEVLAMIAKERGLRVVITGPVVHVSNASKPAAPKQSFTGAPIEVRFDDMPIRAAVKTIADFTKTNITVDGNVDVSVTLHLRKVPWDLALDHLVRKYELRLIHEADDIRIARP